MAAAPKITDLPQCPVCYDGFREPKMLRCTHLVCKKCLVSWLGSEGVEGGCPLCRDPILPPTVTSQGQQDPEALVDDLPTDLATMALAESHYVLSGRHVCAVCEDNSAATSFCFQCDVKLCEKCVTGHTKLPSLKNHKVEKLSGITARQLAETERSACKEHQDKPAEVFCSQHQELLCGLCATTRHRNCAEVKAIADAATEKRVELEQLVQRLRDRETALKTQMTEVKDMFTIMRTDVDVTFEDLEQSLQTRLQESIRLVQEREDSCVTSLAELEKWRAALAINATSVEKLLESASGGALLGMLNSLKSHLNDLELRTGTLEKFEVKAFAFEPLGLDEVKAGIASLGNIVEVTMTTTAAPSATAQRPAQQATSETLLETAQGPELEATFRTPSATAQRPAITRRETGGNTVQVGDRVKPGPNWCAALGSWSMKGTVTAFPSRLRSQQGKDPEGLVDVQWDNGYECWYYMGRDGVHQIRVTGNMDKEGRWTLVDAGIPYRS